jgi:hypothetical protein
MLIDVVKIHDKFSFEIKLNYKLDNNLKTNFYEVNTYLFIPENLDINHQTYSKNDFYSDLKSYIRLKTPEFCLKNVIAEKNSPFSNLKKTCLNVSQSISKENLCEFEYHLKMFCSITKKSLAISLNNIERKFHLANVKFLIDDFFEESAEILSKFRELEKILSVPLIPEKTFLTYKYGDEFLSNIAEIYMFNFIKLIGKKRYYDFTGIKNRVLLFINDEIEYRKSQQMESIPDPLGTNDVLLYRRAELKKMMDNKLFLNTRATKDGYLAEQLIFSTAAGLAMLFATIVAFISKVKYGSLSVQFFFILVVSYMLKDRIKELLRLYFNNKIKHIFFDFKTKIYSDNNQIIGISKESFDFVKMKNIKEKILKFRRQSHNFLKSKEFIREKIIVHRKQIQIFSDKFINNYYDYNFDGITDITRFNIENFIKKMDNPSKKIYVLDEEKNDFHKIKANRVYHLNMVIQTKFNQKTFYNKFRILLNREGIKKIEQIQLTI